MSQSSTMIGQIHSHNQESITAPYQTEP